MTNILAAITITVATNWTQIGSFTPKGSAFPSHDIEEGRIVTNTIAAVEWKGQQYDLQVESTIGPVIGERKIARQLQWSGGSMTVFTSTFPATIYTTNVIGL